MADFSAPVSAPELVIGHAKNKIVPDSVTKFSGFCRTRSLLFLAVKLEFGIQLKHREKIPARLSKLRMLNDRLS